MKAKTSDTGSSSSLKSDSTAISEQAKGVIESPEGILSRREAVAALGSVLLLAAYGESQFGIFKNLVPMNYKKGCKLEIQYVLPKGMDDDTFRRELGSWVNIDKLHTSLAQYAGKGFGDRARSYDSLQNTVNVALTFPNEESLVKFRQALLSEINMNKRLELGIATKVFVDGSFVAEYV